MSDPSQDDHIGAEDGVFVEGEASGRARAAVAQGWGKRPATGRSFLTVMVLAVLATGAALFVALRAQTERDTKQSETAAPPSGRNVP